jgi:hypothetical protein
MIFHAIGTQLQAGDGGNPETFILIPRVRSISGPSMDAAELNATSMDTPGGFEDFIQGLKTWGTLQFAVLWDPTHAMHAQLFADYSAVPAVERNYRLILPNVGNTIFSFKAFVKSLPATLSFDAIAEINVTLRIKADPLPILA